MQPAPWMPDLEVPSVELLTELRELAVSLAEGAGRLIVDERPDALGVAETKSSEVDIVTVMDQRSEIYLRERIAEARPDDAILGEEEGVSGGTSGLTWVIDPIDGTVNYLYGHPLYAVSVAVAVGDVTTDGAWFPVAGAVHAPESGETFHAASGLRAELRRVAGGAVAGGASPEHSSAHASATSATPLEVPLRCSDRDRLDLALVGTGFGYAATKRAAQADVVSSLLPQVRDIRRGGSAALDLCYVAAGRLDAYYESGINAWDQAAGQIVATESGALVSGAGDTAPGKELVVASAPGIHAALRSCLLDASR